MGVFTHKLVEFTSPIAIDRLYQAICLDNPNFLPKVLPDFIKSVEFLQGDSHCVGCVKLIRLADGRPFKYLIARVDAIDEASYYFKYTTVLGDVLGDTLESVEYEYKFDLTADGNTHFILTAHYHTKGGYVMTEQDFAGAVQGMEPMFKPIQDYLIAHPELYA